MSDEPAAWPDDDEDPFAPTSSDEEEAQDEPLETDTEQEPTDVAEEDNHTSSEIENPEEIANQWTLPVRVAPILSMSGEEVAEFPLNESPNGRKNTSLIVSDNLIRVIEATYDDDRTTRPFADRRPAQTVLLSQCPQSNSALRDWRSSV